MSLSDSRSKTKKTARPSIGRGGGKSHRDKALGRPTHKQFKLDHYPFYLMARAWSTYTNAMTEELKSIKMDQPGWRILMILGDENPSSVSSIAEKAVMKLSTITRAVQRLQSEDLVRCGARAEDRRVTEVFITRKGYAALTEVKEVAARIFDRAFDGMDHGDIAMLKNKLRNIQGNLTRSPYS